MHIKLTKQLIAFSLLLLHSIIGWAHSPTGSEAKGLEYLVSQADAIVYGTVIDIAYRNSEPTENSPQGLPHTFVTYKIADIMKGKIDSSSLTLKIPGGADGKGGIYNVSTSPTFSKGQNDVLFVRAKNVDNCPLVNCVDGRFRVADQRVYNGWGVPLVSVKRDLVFGGKPRFDLNVMDIPRPDFELVLQQANVKRFLKIKGINSDKQLAELQYKYEKEAPETYQVKLNVDNDYINDDDSKQPLAQPFIKYTEPIFVDDFMSVVRELNSQLSTPKLAVKSANIKDRFLIKDPRLEAMVIISNDVEKISEEEKQDLKKKFD
ncbi:hypothetical protein MNBD_GAMMA16-149 [hydrothermal vent metagenome]|uniref:Uncharacterized protein n=1 Tax=hydrothermal vent metagenome TaxID=652676 RepID=A0A3B0ZBC5_9ZZZZ